MKFGSKGPLCLNKTGTAGLKLFIFWGCIEVIEFVDFTISESELKSICISGTWIGLDRVGSPVFLLKTMPLVSSKASKEVELEEKVVFLVGIGTEIGLKKLWRWFWGGGVDIGSKLEVIELHLRNSRFVHF